VYDFRRVAFLNTRHSFFDLIIYIKIVDYSTTLYHQLRKSQFPKINLRYVQICSLSKFKPIIDPSGGDSYPDRVVAGKSLTT
jgi:hypothetical protein